MNMSTYIKWCCYKLAHINEFQPLSAASNDHISRSLNVEDCRDRVKAHRGGCSNFTLDFAMKGIRHVVVWLQGAHSMLAWLLCVLMAVLTAGGGNKGKLYSACHMQCVQQFDKCLQLDNCGRPFKIEQDLPKHCWNKYEGCLDKCHSMIFE